MMKMKLLGPAIVATMALATLAVLPAAAQAASPARGFEVRDQSTRAMRAAAESGLRKLVFDMGVGLPANGKLPADFPFAVSSYAELRQVTLGNAFEVYTIRMDNLLAAPKGAAMDRLVTSTGTWNFVVLSKGSPVALLEVGKLDGRWQVLSAGASKLSNSVDAMAKANAADGNFRFVRVYAATADLMEVRDGKGQARYIPFEAARQSMRMKTAIAGYSQLAASDVLPQLQRAALKQRAVRAELASPQTR